MSSADLTNPINQAEALQQLARLLRRESIVAVDTESNSLFAYRERVCLIQFSTPGADYLVDTLALSDLSPLAPVFAGAEIEKVFHAAEYDLLCLKRDYGFSFANIFDTMLAARILGMQEVGLGAALEAEFGMQVDKRHQRANWGQRPLPEHLLAYARQDTHYLIELRNRWLPRLHEKGLWPLAQEDFQRLCRVERGPADNGREGCWRVKNVHTLTPQQAAILKELCKYREQMARSLDRPLFKVIGDRSLVEVAMAAPQDAEALSKLPGMTRGQVQRHGRAILQAVKRGQQAQPIYPRSAPRPNGRYLARLETLRTWRKYKGQEMGLESDIILPRELLHELAECNFSQPDALKEAMRDYPWRYEKFGGEILEVLHKR